MNNKIIDSWNPGPLLRLLQDKLKPEDYLIIKQLFEAIWWKLELARYHAEESLSAIPQSLPEGENQRQAAGTMALMHITGHSETEQFGRAQFLCEAHAIACAQALHSIGDILSRLVKRLEKAGIAPNLSAIMETAKGSETFRYLDAYVNTTKHISLVDRQFAVGIREDEHGYGLMLNAFTYTDKKHKTENWPSKWVDTFLRESYDHLSQWSIDVGHALDAHIGVNQITASGKDLSN